jgi:addiction module RelE/StbE family toxin
MLIQICYTPSFIKQYNKLEKSLQEETKSKIELFKDRINHKSLKVHKLKGRLQDRWSFSINYNYRIVFQHLSVNEVILLVIGDHSIYN